MILMDSFRYYFLKEWLSDIHILRLTSRCTDAGQRGQNDVISLKTNPEFL